MHAVFVVSELEPSRRTEAETMLKTRIVPQIKQAPGFVSGTWTRSPDGKEGRSIVVFESEEAARATLASVTAAMPSDGPVKILTTSVLEVIHQV
jgi:heme-degrading monooxygenase HmoA